MIFKREKKVAISQKGRPKLAQIEKGEFVAQRGVTRGFI